MLNSLYIYMAEKDGMLNTRESRINRAISELRKSADPNRDFSLVLMSCGIQENSLTLEEKRRIKCGVEKGRK